MRFVQADLGCRITLLQAWDSTILSMQVGRWIVVEALCRSLAFPTSECEKLLPAFHTSTNREAHVEHFTTFPYPPSHCLTFLMVSVGHDEAQRFHHPKGKESLPGPDHRSEGGLVSFLCSHFSRTSGVPKVVHLLDEECPPTLFGRVRVTGSLRMDRGHLHPACCGLTLTPPARNNPVKFSQFSQDQPAVLPAIDATLTLF